MHQFVDGVENGYFLIAYPEESKGRPARGDESVRLRTCQATRFRLFLDNQFEVGAMENIVGERVVVSVVGSTLGRIRGILTNGTLAENGRPCLTVYDSEKDYEVTIFLEEDAP